MPHPKDPNKFPRFFFSLANLLGEKEERISFSLSSRKEVFELKNKFWAFRKAIKRELDNTKEIDRRIYLERLYKNMSAYVCRSDLNSFKVFFDPLNEEPIYKRLEEQMKELGSSEEETEIDLTGPDNLSDALDRFRSK